MAGTIRLTAAQAMMRWLSVQMTEDGERFIEGCWAASWKLAASSSWGASRPRTTTPRT